MRCSSKKILIAFFERWDCHDAFESSSSSFLCCWEDGTLLFHFPSLLVFLLALSVVGHLKSEMAFGCHRPPAQSGPAGSPFLFKMGPPFRRFFSPPPSSPSSEGEYGSEINSLDPDGWCNCMTVTEAAQGKARLSRHFAFLLSSRHE